VARIFNRVADAADADPRAFTIATELYPFVRASADPESSIRWLGHATGRWATLFRHAVTSGNMHFASRLYADFQADGETVPQASQLAFIRAIAQTQSSSRRVLLDRHIKDYLWDGAPTEPLVTALCLGLANSPDDAQFAVHLSASIRPNQPLAPEAIAALVPVLITSARENRRQLALSLLSQLPDGESARPALHAAALALRRNIAITGIEPLLRVYRLLATRGIESTGETASIFMVTLLKAYETKVALAIFESAIADNRADVHPAAVSSLMIRLAQTGRTAYAYNAEKQWRALLPTPRDADGVIFGARLFVDIKAGKPVNLAQYVVNKAVVPSEGWAPTRPFFRWLERAQHEQRGAEEGEWVSLLGPMRVAEVAENPEESLEKVVLGENTDLSDNAEPAEESESAEQATAAEEEDPRTVPRQTSTETQVHMCGSSLGTGTVSFA
jgi:hypothetical protein